VSDITDLFDSDDEVPEHKLYLTAEGRKQLGLPEIILTIRLPAAGSPCMRELRNILGAEFDFDRSKPICVPWLALHKSYREARQAYRKETTPYVPSLDVKEQEEQASDYATRTTKARTAFGIEVDKAIIASKILKAFLAENGPQTLQKN